MEIHLQLPVLWKHQAKFVNDTAPIVVRVSGTKAGKTAAATIKATMGALNNAEWLVWWVAPTYRQAKIGFRVIKRLTRDIPDRKIKNTDLTIAFPNGSVVECRSAEIPDNLYGEGVNLIIVDEAGRMTNEALYAIETTGTATNAQICYISNPGPTEGYFYRLCQLGKDPTEPDYSYERWLTSYSPLVRKEILERRKRALPPRMFRTLYEGEFLEGEDAVFRGVDEACAKIRVDEVVRVMGKVLPAWTLHRNRTAGVDLGKHHDYTVLWGVADKVDQRDGYQLVAFDRFMGISWPQTLDRIEEFQKTMNCAITVETNGVGDAIYDGLVERGVPVNAFLTTNRIKQSAILGFAKEIESGTADLADIAPIAHELKVFRYELLPSGNFRYKAPEGMFDDIVMAGAIASFTRRTHGRALAGSGEMVKPVNAKEAADHEQVMGMVF